MEAASHQRDPTPQKMASRRLPRPHCTRNRESSVPSSACCLLLPPPLLLGPSKTHPPPLTHLQVQQSKMKSARLIASERPATGRKGGGEE
jgi:hypothetical protein